MIRSLFHRWERRLADVTQDRVVRPVEWGLDWLPQNCHAIDAPPAAVLGEWVSHVMRDTTAFFSAEPTDAYTFDTSRDGDGVLRFPSALTTPHLENNTVWCRYFPARES